MESKRPEIAIVGAGPSGCALACFLRQRGVKVIVFDSGQKPDLLVGESLIPAAVPLLQRLGIEDRIRAVSVLKPGATLMHVDGRRADFTFNRTRGKTPDYAYNVPRPAFDGILIERAKELGVKFVHERARMSTPPDTDSIREISLSNASLEAAELRLDEHPELLVDATGRARLFARTLKIESTRGQRDDVAYFAHFENCSYNTFPQGQIAITMLKQGWSWRIPQQNRLSLGVVIDRQAARRFGDTSQARLSAIIDNEPLLSACTASATRVTPVKSYGNYQLISNRSSGRGWAMVGDAFGFVDPMLSPGLFMALESASLLDKSIHLNCGHDVRLSMDRYNRDIHQWHEAWQDIIEKIYDGSLLQFYQMGKDAQETAGRFSSAHILSWYYSRIIGQLLSGAGTRSAFKRRALAAGLRHLAESPVSPTRTASPSAETVARN